jgi:uncharacterized protein
MKKIFLITPLVIIALTFYYLFFLNKPVGNPVEKIIPRPLNTYKFENLRKTKFVPTEITVGKQIDERQDSVSRMFYFSTPEKPNSKKMLKTSGVINIPKKDGTYPVVVMFRGFIPDPYKSGEGTQPSAKVLAKNDFITLAPDFLGFGESDKGSMDPFENRFQTYTTALSLLSSLTNLNKALDASYSGTITADLTKIGIWGHSNGGSIALSALELSGVNYPTVLWAPVSKSFPYSVLYYTDEYDDQGKSARKVIANFENLYDSDKFSQINYFNWIKAPIEIHQGELDEEVPIWWSRELTSFLKNKGVNVTLITYPNADHNFLPSDWTQSVLDTISFFNKLFK